MLVEVTQQDINKGLPKIVGACAVALAVQRAYGVPTAWIGPLRIGTKGGENGTHDTPPSVDRWIQRFDAGERVEPFSFNIPD